MPTTSGFGAGFAYAGILSGSDMMVNGSRKAFGTYEHREGLRVINSFTKPVPSYSKELGQELGIKAVEYAMLNVGSKLMPQIEQGVASLWSGSKSLYREGINTTKNFAQNIFARGKPQVPNILPKLRESNVGNSSGLVVVSDVKMAEKNVANIVAEDLSYTHSYDHHGHVPGHKRHAARVEGKSVRAAKSEITDVALKKELLPGEGKVGSYGQLKKLEKRGDNLTPHHIPQAAYMEKYGVKSKDGIAIMVEQPTPGIGGRHRSTRTYGKAPDFANSPREELALDILDMRMIYKKDGVYTPEIRSGLQEVIENWKSLKPDLFLKQ